MAEKNFAAPLEPGRGRGRAQAFGLGVTPAPDMLPLLGLAAVTTLTENVLLRDIGRLEKVLAEMPILLPRNGEYVVRLSSNELHLYGRKIGLENFFLSEAGARVRGLGQNADGTFLNVATDSGEVRVTIHRSPYEQTNKGTRAVAVRRKTNPWREPQASPSSSGYTGESRGSCGGGER